MAARPFRLIYTILPFRLIYTILLPALTLWVWLLVIATFSLRWFSIERPGPPVREIFPYGEMRVGVDASYAPFAVATAEGLFGLDIDLAQAIAARLGAPVRFVNMGFDGLYDSLKTDQVDVLISALVTDYSRTNEVLYTLPYYKCSIRCPTIMPDWFWSAEPTNHSPAIMIYGISN